MHRRNFLRAGSAVAALGSLGTRKAHADVPDHQWDNFDFGYKPTVADRLNQGPFGNRQAQGERAVAFTTFSDQKVRNYGLGMVGYAWEENGPSLAARAGKESLETHVDKLSSLPFMDLLYIRCDWRDVQTSAGKLNLHPIWKATMAAAKQKGLRVCFRIQMSSPNIQPKLLSLPDFLQEKIPIIDVGSMRGRGGGGTTGETIKYREPQYSHPEFLKAFRELNELLAAELDGHPLIEFKDLMMYGWWGEGHALGLKPPFPDYITAERTFAELTRIQLETWKKTPLMFNTQPDNDHVGNHEVQDIAARAGCWLRSDSVIGDEPIQIEALANRPQWLAVKMEDGRNRHHLLEPGPTARDQVDPLYRERTALHSLDLCANYWALWTEADNLRRYAEKYPRSFNEMQKRLGYRIRPGWLWQRQRYGATEIVVGLTNDGVSGIPGVLRLSVETPDGKVKVGGGLDAGHPYGGRMRQAAIMLPKELKETKLVLRAEIEGKGGIRKPVRFACAEPLNADGSFPFDLGSARRGA